MMQWFGYFIISFAISFLIEFLIVQKFKKDLDIKRLGGLGIIIAFFLSLFFNSEIIITSQIGAILIGIVAILIFGLLDDYYDLSWKNQLFFQLSLGMLLIFFGYQINYISNPLGGIIRFDFWQYSFWGLSFSIMGSLLVIFWLIVIINAINWSDGVDGLSGGISLLASLAIFYVSLRPEVNQPALAIIVLLMAGALLGFWWFNFSPGKIEAGSSGSYFMGFVLAALAIMAGTKIATALIILAVPVVDFFWVILERKKSGQSIVAKDIQGRHLHYKLRNLGWSDRKILFGYLGFLASALFLSLYFESRADKLILLIVEGLVVLGFLFWINNQTEKNDESKNSG